MALKAALVAVSAEDVRATFGETTRTSKMRDEIEKLADEVKEYFGENPGSVQLWIEFVPGDKDKCVGVRWMDLEEDLQDACKREKGGGMSAIASSIARNFKVSHGINARLVKAGDDATSGEIYFTRWTPKGKKSGKFPATEAERLDAE